MDLLVEDVADLLKVAPDTVEKWVTEGTIPSYQINNQTRFNPEEVENWMLQRGSSPMGDAEESQKGTSQFILYRALHRGEVFLDIPGETKEEVIEQTIARLSEKFDFDREAVTSMFLERERMMPTALGHGVAVPHTRDFKLNSHFDAVAVVFPKKPLEYDALDGEPVHALFFLFACDDRRHLNLLAKIAHLTGQEEGQELLKKGPSKAELLEFMRSWETKL